MRWGLSKQSKMAAVIAGTGMVLVVLNGSNLRENPVDGMDLLSAASALFVLLLGIALLLQRETTE